LKHRFEDFGGIIAGEEPPFLAFVDREYMRGLGLGPSPLWQGPQNSIGRLQAPVEVHMALTNRCSAGCPHCYMDAGEPDSGELDTAGMRAALQALADMEVFHVALGGGEALERPDLFELAEFARHIGLVPNLTVSGRGISAAVADKMRVFGQVNVSMDGTGSAYEVFRGRNDFDMADRAVAHLVKAGVPTGINCVVGHDNFEQIPKLFAYARRKGLNEVEFLRFKPAGRIREAECYLRMATTQEQNAMLTQLLAEMADRCEVTAKIDCSFIPMFCHHSPPVEALEALGTNGCEAGNVLWGVRSNGAVAGCSFLEPTGRSVLNLARDPAEREKTFAALTSWTDRAPEPCASCDYLTLCRGGCRAVSLAVIGDIDAPDPGCPRVVHWNEQSGNHHG
jgi:radical SAM protein with 4Fe4S-binding SPASM domain